MLGIFLFWGTRWCVRINMLILCLKIIIFQTIHNAIYTIYYHILTYVPERHRKFKTSLTFLFDLMIEYTCFSLSNTFLIHKVINLVPIVYITRSKIAKKNIKILAIVMKLRFQSLIWKIFVLSQFVIKLTFCNNCHTL